MIEHGALHLADSRLAGNTWGMSGPQFLGWYLLLGAVAVIFMIVALRRTARGNGLPSMDVKTLDAMQVAVLNGGSLPAMVALAHLREQGLIDAHGRLIGVPADIGNLDEVTRAVYRQLRPDRTVKAREAQRRPEVRRALERVSERLRKGGLLAERSQQYTADCVRAVLPAAAVVVLGCVRVASGMANGKPVGILVFLVILIGVAIPVALATVPSRTSKAGQRALDQLRGSYWHLDPSSRPSFPTYGPGALALSVAVFGGTALVVAEPDFASAVGAKDAAASSGGGGDGGGGGCGGGGCGGGCGG